MKTKLLKTIMLCVLLTISASCAGSSVTVKLKVVGENYQPIADADIVKKIGVKLNLP